MIRMPKKTEEGSPRQSRRDQDKPPRAGRADLQPIHIVNGKDVAEKKGTGGALAPLPKSGDKSRVKRRPNAGAGLSEPVRPYNKPWLLSTSDGPQIEHQEPATTHPTRRRLAQGISQQALQIAQENAGRAKVPGAPAPRKPQPTRRPKPRTDDEETRMGTLIKEPHVVGTRLRIEPKVVGIRRRPMAIESPGRNYPKPWLKPEQSPRSGRNRNGETYYASRTVRDANGNITDVPIPIRGGTNYVQYREPRWNSVPKSIKYGPIKNAFDTFDEGLSYESAVKSVGINRQNISFYTYNFEQHPELLRRNPPVNIWARPPGIFKPRPEPAPEKKTSAVYGEEGEVFQAPSLATKSIPIPAKKVASKKPVSTSTRLALRTEYVPNSARTSGTLRVGRSIKASPRSRIPQPVKPRPNAVTERLRLRAQSLQKTKLEKARSRSPGFHNSPPINTSTVDTDSSDAVSTEGRVTTSVWPYTVTPDIPSSSPIPVEKSREAVIAQRARRRSARLAERKERAAQAAGRRSSTSRSRGSSRGAVLRRPVRQKPKGKFKRGAIKTQEPAPVKKVPSIREIFGRSRPLSSDDSEEIGSDVPEGHDGETEEFDQGQDDFISEDLEEIVKAIEEMEAQTVAENLARLEGEIEAAVSKQEMEAALKEEIETTLSKQDQVVEEELEDPVPALERDDKEIIDLCPTSDMDGSSTSEEEISYTPMSHFSTESFTVVSNEVGEKVRVYSDGTVSRVKDSHTVYPKSKRVLGLSDIGPGGRVMSSRSWKGSSSPTKAEDPWPLVSLEPLEPPPRFASGTASPANFASNISPRAKFASNIPPIMFYTAPDTTTPPHLRSAKESVVPDLASTRLPSTPSMAPAQHGPSHWPYSPRNQDEFPAPPTAFRTGPYEQEQRSSNQPASGSWVPARRIRDEEEHGSFPHARPAECFRSLNSNSLAAYEESISSNPFRHPPPPQLHTEFFDINMNRHEMEDFRGSYYPELSPGTRLRPQPEFHTFGHGPRPMYDEDGKKEPRTSGHPPPPMQPTYETLPRFSQRALRPPIGAPELRHSGPRPMQQDFGATGQPIPVIFSRQSQRSFQYFPEPFVSSVQFEEGSYQEAYGMGPRPMDNSRGVVHYNGQTFQSYLVKKEGYRQPRTMFIYNNGTFGDFRNPGHPPQHSLQTKADSNNNGPFYSDDYPPNPEKSLYYPGLLTEPSEEVMEDLTFLNDLEPEALSEFDYGDLISFEEKRSPVTSRPETGILPRATTSKSVPNTATSCRRNDLDYDQDQFKEILEALAPHNKPVSRETIPTDYSTTNIPPPAQTPASKDSSRASLRVLVSQPRATKSRSVGVPNCPCYECRRATGWRLTHSRSLSMLDDTNYIRKNIKDMRKYKKPAQTNASLVVDHPKGDRVPPMIFYAGRKGYGKVPEYIRKRKQEIEEEQKIRELAMRQSEAKAEVERRRRLAQRRRERRLDLYQRRAIEAHRARLGKSYGTFPHSRPHAEQEPAAAFDKNVYIGPYQPSHEYFELGPPVRSSDRLNANSAGASGATLHLSSMFMGGAEEEPKAKPKSKSKAKSKPHRAEPRPKEMEDDEIFYDLAPSYLLRGGTISAPGRIVPPVINPRLSNYHFFTQPPRLSRLRGVGLSVVRSTPNTQRN